MPTNLYERQPGTAKPTPAQIRAVWGWIALCRVRYPDHPAYEGAMAAAEWLVGLSNVPPVTGRAFRTPRNLVEAAFTRPGEDPVIRPATMHLIANEINAAVDTVEAHHNPDVQAYAFGAHAFMSWWAGIAELPADLTPDERGKLPQPRQGAA